MEEKIEIFKSILKENKKALLAEDIGRHAIESWLYTNRVPSEKNAKKISAILGIPLSKIPYYRTERVI